MKTVDLIYFDAGGGHRSAALALRETARALGKPWEMRTVNLQEVLDSLDVFRKVTGLRLEDIYNKFLARGWTLGSGVLLPAMQWVIRQYHPAQVRLLSEHWREQPADLVVSVVPNFNRALLEGLRGAGSSAPFVTVLTDIADYPPHFWIERQEQFVVCGSTRAVAQAREQGHPAERVLATSGMILRPAFHEPPEVNRAAECRALGLDPDAPIALLLFGGHGSPAMFEIARRLDDVQLIAICGHNEKLRERLSRLRRSAPMRVEGFTGAIPFFMQLADFMIGKPGPGSISEAVAMGLPVVVQAGAATLPQERYNALWVQELGLGVSFRRVRDVRGAVDSLLRPERLASCRQAAAARKNRAAFEVIEYLERLLAQNSCSVPSAIAAPMAPPASTSVG